MAKKHNTASPKYADIRAWIKAQPVKKRAKLRKTLTELCRWCKRPEDEGVIRWYEIGIRVAALFPEGAKRTYGDGVIDLLANYLKDDRSREDKQLPNRLRDFRKIASCLTRTQATAWTKKRNKKGKPLTLFHVSSLVSVEDAKKRNAVLTQCLTESWSIRKLRSEVQNLIGRKRSGGGRRAKPKETPTAAIALHDIHVITNQWLDNYDVWFAGKKAALSKVVKREQTGMLLKDLAIAGEDLKNLKDAAMSGLKRLQELKKLAKGAIDKTRRG